MGFLLGGRLEHNEAEIAVALRKAGRPLPTNDLWIAAAAASAGATVITYDGHFADVQRPRRTERIVGLQFTWQVIVKS